MSLPYRIEPDEQCSVAEYHARPGLSQSGMKDLAISPLRYWFLHVNPERQPVAPTPAMIFGSALHCAVLEPAEAFLDRYYHETDASDYPGVLVTIEEIRAWIRSKGGTPKGTRKDEVITQAQSMDASVPILDVIQRKNVAQNAGKQSLSKGDWTRIEGAYGSLMSEPAFMRIMADGRAEVPMFATDADTGVQIKACLDWVAPNLTMDVKTFSQIRSKSIDQTVHDAIWYEKYHWQAFWYNKLRRLNSSGVRAFPHVIAFVESEPPYDVRLKRLVSGSLLWDTARIETSRLTELYALCSKKFGNNPWRDQREIEELEDGDIKQAIY